MQGYLERIRRGESLTKVEAKAVCTLILDENTLNDEIVSCLKLLHQKKESAQEISGFREAILETTETFPDQGMNLIDVCGTGGDGAQTFNVSTGVALLIASLGVKVAKHGNRGVSSKSGSSDVLKCLGIRSDVTAAESNSSLNDFGISFLFAPGFYPVLARLAAIRKSIPHPTLFNVLGPLLNPAPVTHQLMGVYSPSLLETSANVLRERGVKRAFIVHGSDGLDELTLTGPSHVVSLQNGDLKNFTLNPSEFGLSLATAESVKGGGPEVNAQILMQIFAGERSAKRDLLVMNAAAALVVAEVSHNFKDASLMVCHALDTGRTLKLIERLTAKTKVVT